MSEFLFEVGLEEVPARMIASAEAELARRVTALLERERLAAPGSAVKSFSTPRRLAVLVGGVTAKQEDLSEDLQGPSAKIAYKDGAPTAAAHAFAKKAGVAVEALRTIQTPKGEYLAAIAVKPGRTAAEVLISELPKELAAIYWAKNMYWRPGKPERFVRPVRWLAALLDSEIVPIQFAGYTASNLTYGHRVLAGASPITLSASAEYASKLEAAFVLADVEFRRYKIRKALDHVCRTLPGTRWREDHELVDKLTHLCEWPSVIAGSFEPEYLALPEEVLVTVMRDHQSYFAVESSDGKLAPYFLAVLNTVANAAGEAIIRHGNQRVLRARFNDARFFWQFDQRASLLDRVPLLENVTFQKDLGSYAAKTTRVRALAAALSTRVPGADAAALDQAALLSKTDLTSELVKEFTELQGIVGGLYARTQGYSEKTAVAIYDHYLPKSMEDGVPRTTEGALLAIADKADTIAGMFSLGLEPTGSKDPFALRRAANGVVKILAETSISLSLGEIAFLAANGREELVRRMELFFAERLAFYLREVRAQAYDVVAAVLAVGSDGVRDAIARAEALSVMRGTLDLADVIVSFKRIKNILTQAKDKGLTPGPTVRKDLFETDHERHLEEEARVLAARVAHCVVEKDYVQGLKTTASLRLPVTSFFENVMVMVENEEVRANRLALLESLQADFSGIADFSEIVVAGETSR